jgi:amino acid adenylation domain-containing protein
MQRSMIEMFRGIADMAAARPDAPAVALPDTEWTYARLAAEAERLSRRLIREVPPGTPVAVLAADRAGAIAAMLAVFSAGCVFVPLDPEIPEPRLAAMLDVARYAGEPIAIVAADLLPLWRRIGPAGVSVITPDEGDEEEDGGGESLRLAGPDDLAYVIFTSGSTGTPKAIAGRLKGVAHFLDWEAETFGVGPGTRVSQITRPTFDAFFRDTLLPLTRGGTVCVPPAAALGDGAALARWLDGAGVEIVHCVPSLFRTLLAANLTPAMFPRLRHVLLAGERLLPADVARWVEVFGERIELVNLYGPSETTMVKLFHRITPADASRTAIPIGKPMPGARALIVDARDRPCRPGAVGEILIRTPYRTLGYLGRPDLTAAAFVPNPLTGDAQDLVYRTGDLGRQLPDGDLEFLGRRDQQVKIRGVRIELAEVEERLRRVPGIDDAVVIDREDEPGAPALAAYCVSARPLDPGALRAALAADLPDVMLPSSFTRLAELPRTLSGKVDRRALPEPERGRTGPPTAPRTPLEEALAGLFGAVLGGVPVGIDDRFFDLGGHSLLATQLLARVRESLGYEVPLRALFDTPTVAGLAAWIEERGTVAASHRLRRGERGEHPPLSFSQQRLWFLDRLGEGAAWVIWGAVGLLGDLDLGRLAASLGEVVRRHEALRTTFPARDGEPWQRIAPPAPVPLPLVDLSALPAAARAEEAQRLHVQEIRRPFDLETGPLLRATVLRLGAARHELLLAVHHIVSDAWSMEILQRELVAAYRDLAALPEPTVQYADYAVWQRERLRGEALEASLGYWRERLEGVRPLRLPTDGARSGASAGGKQSLILEPALGQALADLARGEGCTLFMVLLAAFDLLLARLAGVEDVTVGSTIAGRRQRELEGLIGFFVNVLPLRVDLAGDPSFRQLLARVREVALGGYAHQDIPFEKLVEELQPERDLEGNPFFDVLINLVNTPGSRVELPGLTFEGREPVQTEAKFALTLTAAETRDGLALNLLYRRDLFSPKRAAGMLDQLHGLLRQAASDPDRALSGYSMIPTLASVSPLPEPFYEPVTATFFALAERSPDLVAVVSGDEVVMTYGDLAARAREVASALAARDLRFGDVVALAGPRAPAMLPALVAILASGGVLLPLDPDLPADRRRRMLAIAGARCLVRVEEGEDRDEVPELRIGPSGRPAEPGGRLLPEGFGRVEPGDRAYLVFTSGTTGQPRGVAGYHKGLSHFVAWERGRFGVGPGDRCAQIATLAVDVPLREVFLALTSGAALSFPPEDAEGDTLEWLERDRVTMLHAVPSVLRGWLSEPSENVRLASLRWTLLVGEPLDAGLVRRFRRAFPEAGGLINLYGSTETNFVKCGYEVPAEPAPGVQPAGFAFPESEMWVIAETPAGDFRLCGAGEPGEVWVRTPFLSGGYLGEPAATASRFVPNPFGGSSGERLYRTGDRGRLRPDGALEVAGRLDDQVKIRGLRVEPAEVAACLAEHPEVRECVVAAMPGRDGEPALVAYVVGAATSAELAAHVARRLPAAFVPGRFVDLPALPRLAGGKVDRRALPAPTETPRTTAAAHPPAGPFEKIVAQVWSEVLGRNGIGREDVFFELGGHSLLATRVASRLERALGVRVPLRRLFEAPRLADLARELEALVRGGGAPTAPLTRQEPRPERIPLSFAQERIWLMDRLSPGNASYNLPTAVRLAGRLDDRALERALTEVVRRHEILRTALPLVGGEPVQAIAPVPALVLPRFDLSALPDSARRHEVERLAVEAARLPFDLARGPLMRAALLRLGEEEHVLLFTVQHAIFDGWSRGILVREAAALYDAYLRGEPSPLPGLPLQYADFTLWERRLLSGEALEAELAWWKRRFAGSLPVLRLPTDRPRPAASSFRGARRSLALSPELSAALNALAREEKATIFMVLLAAFAALLHRYSGQDDLVIGTDVAHRTRVETEGLIGFFVNQLALRLDLSGNPSFRELLARTREVVLGASAHQDLPFNKLVEALNPRREAGRMPLFDVKLGFLNVPAVRAEAAGLELSLLDLESGTAQYDLLVYLGEAGDRIGGVAQYATDLFDAATVERLLARFETLLAGAAADPARGVLDLALEPESAETEPEPAVPTVTPAAERAVEQFRFD